MQRSGWSSTPTSFHWRIGWGAEHDSRTIGRPAWIAGGETGRSDHVPPGPVSVDDVQLTRSERPPLAVLGQLEIDKLSSVGRPRWRTEFEVGRSLARRLQECGLAAGQIPDPDDPRFRDIRQAHERDPLAIRRVRRKELEAGLRRTGAFGGQQAECAPVGVGLEQQGGIGRRAEDDMTPVRRPVGRSLVEDLPPTIGWSGASSCRSLPSAVTQPGGAGPCLRASCRRRRCRSVRAGCSPAVGRGGWSSARPWRRAAPAAAGAVLGECADPAVRATTLAAGARDQGDDCDQDEDASNHGHRFHLSAALSAARRMDRGSDGPWRTRPPDPSSFISTRSLVAWPSSWRIEDTRNRMVGRPAPVRRQSIDPGRPSATVSMRTP